MYIPTVDMHNQFNLPSLTVTILHLLLLLPVSVTEHAHILQIKKMLSHSD